MRRIAAVAAFRTGRNDRASSLLILLLVAARGSAAGDAADRSGRFRLRSAARRTRCRSTRRSATRTASTVPLGQVIGARPTILALGYFHCPNLCGAGARRPDGCAVAAAVCSTGDYSLVVLSIDPAETPADARSAQAAGRRAVGRPDRHGGLALSDRRCQQSRDQRGGRVPCALRCGGQAVPASGRLRLPDWRGIVSGYLLGLGYQPGDVRLGITRAAKGGDGARGAAGAAAVLSFRSRRPAATRWRSCGYCSLARPSPCSPSAEPSCWRCGASGSRR